MNQTLLPAGCYDILPPRARLETQLSYALLNVFEAHGYQQVSPPLIEYTDSLLAGRGAALSPQIIRVMDPQTQKVMGFRADMTLQIGRIATSRLADWPRPLRLCYAGPILRMQGSMKHAERQMRQAGIEQIGSDGAASDAEIILVAMRSLQSLGISELTIDLNFPAIIGAILANSSLDSDEVQAVFEALAHKDASRLKSFQEPACDTLCELMLMSGEALTSLKQIYSLSLPEAVMGYLQHIEQVIALLNAHKNSAVQLSLDVTERGGFDYYTGISFTIYATKEGRQLGRGGRYVIQQMQQSEAAIGCTFYTDSLRDLLPHPAIPELVYVADGIECLNLDKLHDQGFHTILALGSTVDAVQEAKRLGCTYIYQQEKLTKL